MWQGPGVCGKEILIVIYQLEEIATLMSFTFQVQVY
jgi:hypothetical protein